MQSREDKIAAKALSRLQNPVSFRKKVALLRELVRARSKVKKDSQGDPK